MVAATFTLLVILRYIFNSWSKPSAQPERYFEPMLANRLDFLTDVGSSLRENFENPKTLIWTSRMHFW